MPEYPLTNEHSLASCSAEASTGPILIVGYMHSGTTLLQRILARSSEVFSIEGETRFFERIPCLIHRLRELPAEARLEKAVGIVREEKCFSTYTEELAKIETKSLGAVALGNSPEALLARVFSALADRLARQHGARCWLEKTPSHVWCLPKVLRWLPACRVVEVVRDPRDILASKRIRVATVESGRYRLEQVPGKRLEKDYHPVLDTVSWRSAISAGSAAAKGHPAQVYRVSYEELVKRPEEVVSEVFRWLDLHFDRAFLEINFSNAARMGVPKRGIQKDSVGQYTVELPASHVWVCQVVAGRRFRELGYSEVPAQPRSVLAGGAVFLGTPYALVRRLVKRARMGGAGFLGMVLRGYVGRMRALVWGKAKSAAA